MIRCFNCQKKVSPSLIACEYCGKNPWNPEKLDELAMKDGVLYRYNGEETELTLPEGIKIIDSGAFEDSDVASVIISDGALMIKSYAFHSSRKLSYVYIPESAEKIEACAFTECPNLRSVHLPKSCEVEEGAFDEGVTLYRY